jgi:hypothetical protein
VDAPYPGRRNRSFAMEGNEVFLYYWWLIFPIFGMIWGFVEMLAKERRARSLMDLIKSYVDQGKEPPKELLDFASRGMDDEAKSSSAESSTWSFVVFTALAAGFGYGAYLERGESYAFVFAIVAVVMGVLALGALLVLMFGRKT